jgi:hypothetical protein
MNMQDNELDDLFRAKLDGFEAEPSARVWTGIDEELDSKKRKRVLAVLSIAASIVVLVTAGILFIPKKISTDSNKPGKGGLAVMKPQPTVVKPQSDAPVTGPVVKEVQPIVKDVQPANTPAVNTVATVRHDKNPKVITNEAVKPSPVIDNPAPAIPDEKAIAVVKLPDAVKQPDVVTAPIVPDITMASKQNDNVLATVKTPPVVMASNQPKEKATAPKRHGIRSMGDLVNLVVARVDKRKDKMIEFTNTDEDESTITAVNIGPVKIKKEAEK